MPTTPLENSTVLVTGASGFIASHIIAELLSRGARVRGTVRSDAKGENLKRLFQSSGDRFSYVIVKEVADDGAFDEAVKGVSAIIHTAAPLPAANRERGVQEDFINPAVNGTVGILKSAQKSGGVQRVVITSSIGASANHALGRHTEFTEEHWNEGVVEAWEKEGEKISGLVAYQLSKVLAERAAWEYIDSNKLAFDLVTILPSFVVGPIINTDISSIDTCNAYFYDFLTGKEGYSPELAQSSPPYPTVDIRDIAFAHVESLVKPEAGNQRIGVSGPYRLFQEYLDVLRETDPKLAASFPNMTTGRAPPNGEADIYGMDASKSQKVLGMVYRPFKETVVDAARSYLEVAKVKGWKI